MIKNVHVVVKKNGRDALDVAGEVMSYLNSKGVMTTCDIATGRDMDIQGVDTGLAAGDLVLVLGGMARCFGLSRRSPVGASPSLGSTSAPWDF